MVVFSGFFEPLFYLFSIGVGIGEAGGSPPSHSMISDIFPPERRAGAIGFYSTGINFGILFGFLAGGWLNEILGWRNTFYVIGIMGLAIVPIGGDFKNKDGVVEIFGHETYLQLLGQSRTSWQGDTHVLGVAATAMRRASSASRAMRSCSARRRASSASCAARIESALIWSSSSWVGPVGSGGGGGSFRQAEKTIPRDSAKTIRRR